MICVSQLHVYVRVCLGRDSAVGIATGYGLDGPGMESWWGVEIFRTPPDRPRGPTQPPMQWVPGLSRR